MTNGDMCLESTLKLISKIQNISYICDFPLDNSEPVSCNDQHRNSSDSASILETPKYQKRKKQKKSTLSTDITEGRTNRIDSGNLRTTLVENSVEKEGKLPSITDRQSLVVTNNKNKGERQNVSVTVPVPTTNLHSIISAICKKNEKQGIRDVKEESNKCECDYGRNGKSRVFI